VPFDRVGGELLSSPITERYERRATVVEHQLSTCRMGHRVRRVTRSSRRRCSIACRITRPGSHRPDIPMAMKKKSTGRANTAAEIAAELEADPAYREMRARQDAAVAAIEKKVQQAEAPLVRDLNAAGVGVASVWDLVNTAAPYPAGIPVLLEHMQRDYPPEVREGIARSLAVPEASWGWDILLSLFTQEPAGGTRNVKWALACALGGAATDDVLDRLIALVRDKSVGENRMALLSALARSKDPRSRQVLEELRADPQLSREIRILLGSKKRTS
jgi:hypothetical protein